MHKTFGQIINVWGFLLGLFYHVESVLGETRDSFIASKVAYLSRDLLVVDRGPSSRLLGSRLLY